MSGVTGSVIGSFLDALKDTSELIRDVTSREASFLQLKIVLGRQLSLITEAVNKFMQSAEHDSTTMVETIINSIQYVTDILNHLPMTEELNDIRMEVISLSNFLRMNLASFSTSFDMSNKIASASLLSQVLIGDIPKIEKLPDLPPIDNPQKFFETYFLMYNAIQSNIGVYEVLMYTLDVIPYDTMKEWSINVVKNLSLMHNLIHKLKIRQLFETKKIRKPVNLFKNIYYISNTLVSLVYTLHEIYLRFDGIIPKEVISYSPIGKITPLKLIGLVDLYKSLIDQFIEDLRYVYNAKLLNLNDHPEKISEYRLVSHAKELLENIKLELLIVLEGIYESKAITFENYIKSSYNIIDFFIEEGSGVDNIMENYHMNYIIEFTKYTSPYIAQYCLIKGDKTPYYDFLYKYNRIFGQVDKSYDPIFQMRVLFSRMYMEIELDIEIDFEEVSLILQSILKNLELKYLPMMTIYSVFAHMSKLGLCNDEWKESYREFMSHTINEPHVSHLKDKFTEYMDSIFTNNPTGIVSDELILLDPESWCIPDFTDFYIMRGLNPIPVLSFNRTIDSIKP